MIANILHADAVLNVRTHADLVEKHARMLRDQRERGIQAVAHTEGGRVYARVDHGRWLFDCPCNAGVAAHPGWPDARCLGCGAIFTDVAFPADKATIEGALLQRRHQHTRNWRPGETLGDLIAENIDHGDLSLKGAV